MRFKPYLVTNTLVKMIIGYSLTGFMKMVLEDTNVMEGVINIQRETNLWPIA